MSNRTPSPAPPSGYDASAPRVTVDALVRRHADGPAADTVALTDGTHQVTYRELDAMTVRVTQALRRSGIRRGDFVGIRMPRSPLAVAAMLGVLRTGAAYVPIDLADPVARARHVTGTAGVALVLTGPGAPLPDGLEVPELMLDEDGVADSGSTEAVAGGGSTGHDRDGFAAAPVTGAFGEPGVSGATGPTGDGAPVPAGEDIAYALFTSGSTGMPKGALMTHGALVNLLTWHDRARPDTCRLRTAQVCPLSFDFSFHEIFSTLAFGGTLVFVDDEVRRNPFALLVMLRRERIERLFLAVPLLDQIAQAAAQEHGDRSSTAQSDGSADGRLPSLREVVTTGQQLRITPHVRNLFRRSGARLHNHYGATEFQDATAHTLDGNPDTWPAIVPVGRPIDGVDVRIVDEHLAEVPPGEEGELCVLGVGVSPGYLNRRDLTARRFLDDPAGGGRLYRTGDLARVGADGAIELRGRIDTQVKVHGARIEAEEIETLLLEHPGVQDTAVLAHEVDGYTRLVAHVVPTPDLDPDEAQRTLDAFLSPKLSRLMLPEAYVLTPTMPLTPSGKTDRARLAPPETFARLATAELVDAHGTTEQVLTDVWRTVLRLDAISVDDRFFDLGGTSLLLTRVRHELVRRLNRDVPMVDLLRHATIRSFAAHLDGGTAREDRAFEVTRSRRGTAASMEAGESRETTGTTEEGTGASGATGTRAEDVAIIGMAGRFPGAPDVDTFWRHLRHGLESVGPLPGAGAGQRDAGISGSPDFVAAGAVLPGIDSIDAEFFQLSAKEAELLDPQQRLFLECAWEAMESAGHAPGGAGSGRVGVFAGAGMSTYLLNNLAPHFGYGPKNALTESDLEQFRLKLGNDGNYLATRVSYALDLRGPSIGVQSACSTSLVAVHLACRSLADGDSDMALAGGVHVVVPQDAGYLHEEGMIMSADGHTRAFDADATGTLFTNGCGIVVLKRLSRALADGDRVIAVIKGSAVNNDGSEKISFTAPSVDGQAEVVRTALRRAGVTPSEVGFVEAHGTGTALGDPMELASLAKVFGDAPPSYGSLRPAIRCEDGHGDTGRDGGGVEGAAGAGNDRSVTWLGSVKTNVGHLDEAAGVTGLIKAALCVRDGVLVPSLHYRAPNPEIDFDRTPFRVSTTTQVWETGGAPRTAGVTSLGVGGTNAHVVVQQASAAPPPEADRAATQGYETEAHPAPPDGSGLPSTAQPAGGQSEAGLLVLSARSEQALDELAQRYADHMADAGSYGEGVGTPAGPAGLSAGDVAPSLADVCFTAATGRRHFPYRRAVVAGSPAEAAARLREAPGGTAGPPGRLAFLFPGQGPQYVGMGRELYARERVFRAAFDRCYSLLRDVLDRPLHSVLFATGSDSPSPIGETRYAQPALFAFEYALGRLWLSWGVRPDVLLGHSHGEYAAACLAGVFSLEDALTLVTARGRLMQDLTEPGTMVAVAAPEDAVAGLLGPHSSVAVVNGPQSVVISGRQDEIGAACAALTERGVRHRRLDISIASHSPLMRPMVEEFAAVARTVRYEEPRIGIVSTVTGAPVGAEIADWRYWADQISRPVRFHDAATALRSAGVRRLLEVSPKPTLLQLVEDLFNEDEGVLVPSMRADGGHDEVLAALGALYETGVDPDWGEVFGGRGLRKVALPTYPWQRVRHWIDAPAAGHGPGRNDAGPGRSPGSTGTEGVAGFLGARLDLAGGGGIRFTSVVGVPTLSWLGDHRVFKTVVMPGVAYQELACAAAAAAFGPVPAQVRDFHIHRALAFPDDRALRRLQVVLAPEDDGGFVFEVHSSPLSAGDAVAMAADAWTLHASARVVPGAADTAPGPLTPPARTVDLDVLRKSFADHPLEPAEIYRRERERDIDLGPLFQVTNGLWHRDAEALAHVVLGPLMRAETGRHRIHPVLLEACFLALTVTYPEKLGRRTYVPLGVDRIRVNAPVAGDEAWCHARLRPNDQEGPETLRADVELWAPDGTLLAALDGVLLKRANRATMIPGAREPWRDWLYETRWTPAGPPDPAPAAGRWLVLTDDESPLGAALGDFARLHGVDCTVLNTGADGADIDPAAYDLVVLCPSATGGRPEGGDVAHDAGTVALAEGVALLGLAQRMAAQDDHTPRLCLVTMGARPVGGRGVTTPAAAGSWGLGGVVATEHPELRTLMVDLDPDTASEAQAALLYAELAQACTAQEPSEHFRVGYDGHLRHVETLARTAVPVPDEGQPPPLRPDATYLITGGLGGLGTAAARALADAGARHLVLLGRTAPGEATLREIEELRATGCAVDVVLADVADRAQLARALASVPPPAGVLHLAGVLDDGVLLLQSPERLSQVMAPKALGAWYLHELTRDMDRPLDFFVLFSSVSGLLGTPGQAGYAAANAFLDGLADHRRALGLPALAVQWGSWADRGMSARSGANARLEARGEGVIPLDDGLAALRELLGVSLEHSAMAVLPTDWSRFADRNAPALRGLLSAMPGTTTPPTREPARARVELDALPPADRAPHILAQVQEQVGRVLGATARQGEEDGQNLFARGLDSLTAIELRRNLQRALGCRLRQSAMFDHPTVTALADHIGALIGAAGADGSEER